MKKELSDKTKLILLICLFVSSAVFLWIGFKEAVDSPMAFASGLVLMYVIKNSNQIWHVVRRMLDLE